MVVSCAVSFPGGSFVELLMSRPKCVEGAELGYFLSGMGSLSFFRMVLVNQYFSRQALILKDSVGSLYENRLRYSIDGLFAAGGTR